MQIQRNDANSAKRCKFSKADANSAKRMQTQRNGCKFSETDENSAKRMQIPRNGPQRQLQQQHTRQRSSKRAGHQPHFSARSSKNYQFHSPAPRGRGGGHADLFSLATTVVAGAATAVVAGAAKPWWRERLRRRARQGREAQLAACHAASKLDIYSSKSSLILYISLNSVKNI